MGFSQMMARTEDAAAHWRTISQWSSGWVATMTISGAACSSICR